VSVSREASGRRGPWDRCGATLCARLQRLLRHHARGQRSPHARSAGGLLEAYRWTSRPLRDDSMWSGENRCTTPPGFEEVAAASRPGRFVRIAPPRGDRAVSGEAAFCAALHVPFVRYRHGDHAPFRSLLSLPWCSAESGAFFALQRHDRGRPRAAAPRRDRGRRHAVNSGKGQKGFRCPRCRIAVLEQLTRRR